MSVGFLAGKYNVQVGKIDLNDYPVGQVSDITSIASGTTTTPYRVDHPVTATLPAATRERATALGGQRIIESRDLGISDLGEMTLTFAQKDQGFEALISGGSVDTTTASGVSMSSPNVEQQEFPQLFLILTAGFGKRQYIQYFFPAVTIGRASESLSQDGGTNPNVIEYTVTINSSVQSGLGLLFANTGVNAVNDRDTFIEVVSDNQYSLTTYIDDGTATTFNLGYLPISDTVDGSLNIVSANGADASSSATAINTSTGAVTWTAGSDGDRVIVAFPTRFRPAS